MRSREGQLSDNRPLSRTRVEKEKQLRDLKEVYAGMKPHATPALRESVRNKVRELMAELAVPPPPPREKRPPRREPRVGPGGAMGGPMGGGGSTPD